MRRRVGFTLVLIGLLVAGLVLFFWSGPLDTATHRAGERTSTPPPSPTSEEPTPRVPTVDETPPPAATDEEQPALLLHGEVIDITGAPIARATARIEEEGPTFELVDEEEGETPAPPQTPRATATTGHDGRFTLSIRLSEIVTVTADACAPLQWHPRRKDLPGPVEVRFMLRRAREIKGAVVDTQENPVVGASVSIVAVTGRGETGGPLHPIPEIRTDERGEFVGPLLPQSVLKVSARQEGYLEDTRTLLPDEEFVRLVLEKEPEPATATLLMHLLADGHPLTDGTIGMSASNMSGELGMQAANPVRLECEPGVNVIAVRVDGYLVEPFSVELSPGEVREVDVNLNPGLTFRGYLLTADGAPVHGATVTIDVPAAHFMRTDERGYFSRSGLPPGNHRIRINEEGDGPEVPVTPDRVRLTETTGEVELRMRRPPEVAVTVLFVDGNGHPIPIENGYWGIPSLGANSHPLLSGSARHDLSVRAGRFFVAGLAGGLHYHQRLSVTPDDEGRTFEIAPPPSYSLTGTVRDAVGQPVEGAFISLSGSLGPDSISYWTGRTDAGGSFLIENMYGTVSTLGVSVGGLSIAHRDLKLTAGENHVDVTLSVSGAVGPLEVAVVDPSGRPIEGARIRLAAKRNGKWRSGGFSGQETAADGTYRFEVAGPGPVTVCAEIAGFSLSVPDILPGTGPLVIEVPRVVLVRGTTERSYRQARVCATRVGDGPRLKTTTKAHADGTFEIELLAGTYNLYAYDHDFVTGIVTVEVQADVTAVVLRPGLSGRLRGTLPELPYSTFLPSITFHVTSGAYEGLLQESTIISRTFESPALPPGPVSLRMWMGEWNAVVAAGTMVDLGALTVPDRQAKTSIR